MLSVGKLVGRSAAEGPVRVHLIVEDDRHDERQAIIARLFVLS